MIIIIILVVISENFIIYSMNYCTVFCTNQKRPVEKKETVCVRFKTNSLHISKCLISSSADDAKETY
jgi:hypothetical protein